MGSFDVLFRIFILFSFIILLFLSLTSVNSADFGDIRQAINVTDSGKTITLQNTTYNGDGSQIPISKNITIQGPSGQYATLDAKGESRIIKTGNNTLVTFRRIIFKNGFLEGTGAGSAIRAGGQVIIENCTFLNNQGESGTAVFLSPDADNSRINNCIFKGNKGIYAGEDDWVEGAAIDVHAGHVNITNSVFENNQALDTGGAINFAIQSIGSQVINCNFTNNTASTGGAIKIINTDILIRNCKFINNKVNGSGGAVYVRNSKVKLENSIFTSNSANTNGGAIYNDLYNTSTTGYLNISSSNFKDNNAFNGGAIYSKNILNIKYSNFTNNQATNNGGIIYLSNTTMLINTSALVNNSATNGGGIYSSSSNITANYNYIANNNGNKYVYITGSSTLIDLSYNWWGDNNNPLINHVTDSISVVLSDYYTVKVKLVSLNGDLATFNYFLTLKNSESSLGSDYLPVFYGDYYNGTNHTRFQANTPRTIITSLNGDKLFKVSIDDFVGHFVVFVNDIYGDDFYNGDSWGSSLKSLKKAVNLVIDGGYVYIASSVYNGVNNTNILIDKDLNIIGVNDNEVCVVFDGENKFSIFKILNADVKINNITFINGNSANGGAIYSDNSNLTIKDSNFLNNTATNYGGVIAINGGGYFNLSNIKFSNNHATYGAGIYLKNTNNFNLYSSVFENNTGSIGQSIYLDNGNNGFNVSYSLFLDNGNNIVFSNGSNNGYFDYNWWGDNNYTNHTNLKINTYYTAIFTTSKTVNTVVGDNCTIFYSFHLNNTINKGNINFLPDFNVSLFYNDIFIDSSNVKEDKTFKFLLKHVYNNLSIFTNNRVFFLEYLVGKGKLEIKNLTILVDRINYADNITLKIDLKDNFTGKLNITLKTANKTDNDILTREMSFNNGIGYFDYVITLLTNVLFDIQGTNNIDYNNTNNISTWGVVKYYLNISNIIIQNFNYGDDLNINIDLYLSSLNPNITQVFNVTVNGEIREISFINNYGVWVHRVTQAGTVKFNVNLEEDDYYYSANKNTSKFFNCTFYIDSVNGDNSNIGTSPDKSFKDFKHALNLLISGGTIYALNGTYNDENNTNITIKKDVNLYGWGNVIFTTKSGDVRVFNVENGLLYIANITFSDISFNGGGGVIYTIANGCIEVIDSKFVGNSINGNGVLYLNSSGNIINRTEFINNNAINGGAIFINGNNNIITSSSFVDNKAHNGGAISISGDDNTINYTRFFNNIDDTLKQVYNSGYGSNLSFNWWGDNFNPLGAHINNTGSVNSLNYYKVVFKDSGEGLYSYQLAINGDDSDGASNFLSFNGSFKDKMSSISGVFRANTGLKEILVNGSLGFVMFNVDNWNNMMIFVNGTGGSDLNNGTDWNIAVKTIKRALELVVDEGTIYIAGNITYKSSSNLNQTIAKNVTIIGANSYSGGAIVFDSENQTNINVFNVFDSIVTIKELVFVNVNGTAILSENSKLEVLKCDFINSKSDNGLISLNNSYSDLNHNKFNSINGLVINSFNSNLKINNTLFNSIKTNNDIIHGFNSDLIFDNLEFINIIGKNSIVNIDSGNIHVFNSNFINNNLSAFYVNNSNLAIENSLFDCIKTSNAVIHGFNSDLIFDNLEFINISGKSSIVNIDSGNINVFNSNFINNNISAFYTNNSDLAIENCLFENIKLNNSDIGIIHIVNGNLTINKTIFKTIKNGVILYLNNSKLTLTSSNFINNGLNDNNLIYSTNSLLNLNKVNIINDTSNNNLIFTNNSNLHINSSIFGNNVVNGSAIFNTHSSSNFNNVTFQNLIDGNIVNDFNGEVYFNDIVFQDIANGTLIYTNNSSFNIENSRFKKLKGNLKIFESVNSNLNINNLIFEEINSTNNLFYVIGGSLSFKNSIFKDIVLENEFFLFYTNNSNVDINNFVFNSAINGRFLNVYGGIVNINNSVFKSFNNSNIINNNGKLGIINSNFTDIHVNGVIYNNGVLNIANSLFKDICSDDESVIFNDGNLIVNCSVFENISSNGDGGVIYSTNALNIVFSNFTNNKAVNGGSIYSTGLVTIDSSFFTGNTAEKGGSIYLEIGSASISYSQFKGNNASYGGGIYSENVLSLVACKFENNNASNGGAIYSTDSLSVRGGSIINNNAGYGSGIYSSGNLNLSSVYFSGNEAEISGIELFSDDSSYSGSNLIVEASLYSGDNLLNFVFSESLDVYIDGTKQTLSDLSINTVITLNFEDNVYSAITGNDGVATFVISMPLVLKSTFVTVSVIFIHRDIEFSDLKEIEVIGSDEEGEFDDFDDFVFDDEILVESKSNKGSGSSSKSQTSSVSSSKSSTTKLTSTEIKKYTKGFTKTKSYKEGYVAIGSGMKWTKVDWSKTIHNYPTGLRKVNFSVYHKKVKYSSSKYKKTTKDKNGNTVYYKYYLTGKKGNNKYLIVKETWKKNTKKVTKYDNPYLKKSTKCEVNNEKIKNLLKSKEILGTDLFNTKGSKDNQVKKMDKIFKWVGKNVTYYEKSNYSALGVLAHKDSNGKYMANCVGYSNLIAALCRASGIAVKYKIITYFNPSEFPLNEPHLGHAYLFVYLKNEWTAVDGTSSHIIKEYNNSAWAESDTYAKNPTKSSIITDNKYDSFEYNCNHYLGMTKKHSDSNINYTNDPDHQPNYFADLSSSTNSFSSALKFLKNFDNLEINSNVQLKPFNTYINGSVYDLSGKLIFSNVWAFHTYNSKNNKLIGYFIISSNGNIFTLIETEDYLSTYTKFTLRI